MAIETELPPDIEPLLNEHVAANALGVKVSTLRRWRWAGKPPNFHKIGAAVRYSPAEIRRVKAASLRTSTSDPGLEAAVA